MQRRELKVRSHPIEIGGQRRELQVVNVGKVAVALLNLLGDTGLTEAGADELVAHAEKKLGVKLGESTADGRVFLKREEECVAACCGAPVVLINGHYHEKLTTEKVDELLDGLK